MEDFFGEVALQLDCDVGYGQFKCEDSLEKLQESRCRLSEQSWSNFTNFCGEGGLNNRSFIKRRPSKSNKKSRKRDNENRLSESQIISRKPGLTAESINLDRQLNQLQKTLQYPKNSTLNPRFERQKVLIKRLNINKENMFAKIKEEKQSFHVTSKFLQEIKEVNEELYEIYLNLYRFYEKEKEVNATIAKEIKEVTKEVEENAAVLSEIRLDIYDHSLKIEEEKLKDKQIDLGFMRDILSKRLAQ